MVTSSFGWCARAAKELGCTLRIGSRPIACSSPKGPWFKSRLQTHALGRSIYDRDEKLYYRWQRRPQAAESGETEHGHADGVQCSVMSRVLITWLARGLLVVLSVAFVRAVRVVCPLCLMMLEPMLFKPLTSLLVVLTTLFVAIVLPRVVKRLSDEADVSEGDDEIGDEIDIAPE